MILRFPKQFFTIEGDGTQMLSTKQKQLIPLIIKYGNIDKACKAVNVDRTTYYKWLKNEEFSIELKSQQESLYNSSILNKSAENKIGFFIFTQI